MLCCSRSRTSLRLTRSSHFLTVANVSEYQITLHMWVLLAVTTFKCRQATKEAKQAATDRLSNLVKAACLNTSSVCIPIFFDQTMVEVALTMIEDGSLHGSNHLWDLFVTTQLGLKQGSPLQAVGNSCCSEALARFRSQKTLDDLCLDAGIPQEFMEARWL